MILSSKPCNPDKLPRLLSGQLSKSESAELEKHLSYCRHCQSHLEQLAGSREWWETTENVLRFRGQQPTESTSKTTAPESDSLDVPWLSKMIPEGMVGPFRLENTIGYGGTGVVAQAFDTQLNRRVAVKVLYPHLAANGAARQRFAREAQAAAAVVHPSVVPIHAVDADHSPPYLVMAYVPGGSLQQRLDRDGSLELVEILRIALQIADGLNAAHQQGLVHRDVKPANILLEAGTDRVLLTDFGLARALDDATLTASGYVAGTPSYMSPEQARGDAIDGRSDLFSVGSLIYAMATGRAPFTGTSALHVLQKVNECQAGSVREWNERMPEWLDRLIELCHKKHLSHRIASAEKLAELLRQCLAHVQKPNAFDLPVELQVHKTIASKSTLLALAAGTVLGLIVGWVAYQYQPLGKLFGWDNTPLAQQQLSIAENTNVSQATSSKQIAETSNVPRPFNLPSAPLPNGIEDSFSEDMYRIRNHLYLIQKSLEDDWK